MKKQTAKNLLAVAGNTPKLKLLSLPKKVIAKNRNRYIYTEQDLGDDILHIGISASVYASMK